MPPHTNPFDAGAASPSVGPRPEADSSPVSGPPIPRGVVMNPVARMKLIAELLGPLALRIRIDARNRIAVDLYETEVIAWLKQERLRRG